MRNPVNIQKVGEQFGKDIADLVKTNRAFLVTILDVDDDYAYVTMSETTTKIPVRLTGMNIADTMLTIKPNIGSVAIVTLANGMENAPFFIAFSEIDSFNFSRGTTSFTWSMTAPGRDDDGEELEGDTADVVELSIGDSTLKVDTDGWTFNGGELGGLTKTQELKTQLDKVTARIDGILDAINSSTVIATPYDGGSALWALFQAQIALVTDKEDFSSIENTKITH